MASRRPITRDSRNSNTRRPTDAAEQILGANPLLGIDREELLAAGKRLLRLMTLNPQVLIEENLAFARELVEIAMGRSKLAADARDRRFSHEVWQKSGYYRRLMQGFVAWRDMLNRVLDRADTTTDDRERARFVLQLFTETFAPTNSLLGNPGALQRITETRGKSLIYGLQNFIDDLTNNFGMPRQVDERKFQVGRNLATTPGAVVYRGEVLRAHPVHAADRARAPAAAADRAAADQQVLRHRPGRRAQLRGVRRATGCPDLLHQLAQSHRRAARLEHGDLSHGLQAGDRGGARNHRRGSRQRHGGVRRRLHAGHPAGSSRRQGRGQHRKRHAAGHGARHRGADACSASSPRGPASTATIEKSRRKGVLEGSEMARVFAWLRPNDLVWLFVANNWVMGNRPPAFDILYWNSDTTRLPAEFHADLLRMFLDNPLKAPGKITALGTPIDMAKVQVPAYVVAGITDHITPWQACYQSKNILRGKIDFVLSSSGHIQSIVNPPTNPKAKYFLNSALPDAAEDWLAGASEHAGSWWTHWAAWYRSHGGGEVPAPAALGSAQHPAGDPAPGRYVHQR